MRMQGKEVGQAQQPSSPLVFSKLAIKRAIKAFEGWFEELDRKPHVEQIAEELRKRPLREAPKVDVRTIHGALPSEVYSDPRRIAKVYESLPSFGAPKGFVNEVYTYTSGYEKMKAAETAAEVERVEEKMAQYEARDYAEPEEVPVKSSGERLLFQKKTASTSSDVAVPKKKKKEKVKVVISYDDDC